MSKKVVNETIERKVAERHESLREKNVREMTVAEKLIMRGYEQRRTITLKSEAVGDVEIVIRVPLMVELQRLIELIRKSREPAKNTEGEDPEEVAEELYGLLASICLDDSLDVEFFRAGYISSSDFVEIVMNVSGLTQARAQEIDEFRRK